MARLNVICTLSLVWRFPNIRGPPPFPGRSPASVDGLFDLSAAPLATTGFCLALDSDLLGDPEFRSPSIWSSSRELSPSSCPSCSSDSPDLVKVLCPSIRGLVVSLLFLALPNAIGEDGGGVNARSAGGGGGGGLGALELGGAGLKYDMMDPRFGGSF